jgi:heptosyltransferase-2
MPARMPDALSEPLDSARGESKSAERVLVVSPNWLGDAVMALPAIADVKRHFHPARLIVAARRSVAEMFRLAAPVDEVLVFEWGGKLLRSGALRRDLDTLRRLQPDVAILLPNSFASAWVVRQAGIPERWGYTADFRRPMLSRGVRRPRTSVHQAAYYQHLVQQLGIASGPLEPVLAVPDVAVASARALLSSAGWSSERPLVAIAPGAAYGTAKRWLPAHFARLVTTLVPSEGATCALLGSGGDRETTEWIQRMVPEAERRHVLDLAGRTGLDELAGIMQLSSVFVSNDSGAMHMASALGVPVVALFGPTREYETAPLARAGGGRVEVLLNPVWCRPCMLRECPIDHRCMKGLSPERVFTAVREMMAHAQRP